MLHECNAYCRGNVHGEMLFTDNSDIDLSIPTREEVAEVFGPGAHVVSAKSAPECPIDAEDAEFGMTFAYLLIIEVPAEGGG